MRHSVFRWGSVRGWDKCPRLPLCFWQIYSRCGLISASKTANPFQAWTSVPSSSLYLCQRRPWEAVLEFSSILSRGSTFYVHHIPWSFLTLYRCAYQATTNSQTETRHTGFKLRLCHLSSTVSPLANHLNFLNLFPHLSHWGDLTLWGYNDGYHDGRSA